MTLASNGPSLSMLGFMAAETLGVISFYDLADISDISLGAKSCHCRRFFTYHRSLSLCRYSLASVKA